MTEDVLLYVRKPLALALVDGLQTALTHRHAFVRRLSLALLLWLVYSLLASLLSIRFAFHSRSPAAAAAAGGVAASRLDKYQVQDAEAVAYSPTPATAQQRATKTQLELVSRERLSAFDPALFTDGALGADHSKYVGVTAVLLHWKRRQGLQLVVEHISKYPFIREIIIWNNRGVELDMADFTLASFRDLEVPLLRIVNSPANVHDQGKHLACSMATYRHCYFNDDDWLNVYMDSLYTKYLECCAGGGGVGRGGSGGRIASNTMPIIHYEHRRWRFQNPDIDLHTGFTWLGTGSFAPRHLSARFLNQIASLPEPLQRDQALTSDMFFSLFTNSLPEQMPNNLIAIDIEGGEVGWSRSAGVDQWQVVYANVLDGVRRLTDVLTNHQYLCPSPFSVASPPPESHTRSPCANDGCLFITSLSPFPDASALTFPKRQKKIRWIPGSSSGQRERTDVFDPFHVASIPKYEERWNELSDWPDSEWWTKNGSWHLAVDGKGTQTCWQSHKAPDENDYFGLTLVAPRIVEQVKLVGSLSLENVVPWDSAGSGPDSWDVYTVRHALSGWEPRKLARLPSVRPLSTTLAEVTLDLVPQLDGDDEPSEVLKIKFVSRGRQQAPISLCSWQLDSWKV